MTRNKQSIPPGREASQRLTETWRSDVRAIKKSTQASAVEEERVNF